MNDTIELVVTAEESFLSSERDALNELLRSCDGEDELDIYASFAVYARRRRNHSYYRNNGYRMVCEAVMKRCSQIDVNTKALAELTCLGAEEIVRDYRHDE